MTMKRTFQLVIIALVIASGTSKGTAQPVYTPPAALPSWAPDSSCVAELERGAKPSVRCREQLDYAKKRMDEETRKCSAAMKKVYALCGIGTDASAECYKKHRTDLEAGCGE